jgi:uncharacterized RDD family membrane protein YckC
VANETYWHADLAELAAPRADAGLLAGLLADPSVGAFDVKVHHDLPAQEMRVVLEAFLADRRPDDLAVLYFSGHGIKALSGALHLAAVDTDPRLLAATSLRCDFVQGLMADSRARRIALFLDCCYGGAFVHGMTVKSGREVHVRDTFADLDDVDDGRGRVIITASTATQFAFEDGHLRQGDVPAPSRFTRAVVAGLADPATDRNNDGWIGLHELFLHVEDSMRRAGDEQTPQMWALGAQGDIRVARSPGGSSGGASEAQRLDDVEALRLRLRDDDVRRALDAYVELQGLTDHAATAVAEAAVHALEDANLVVVPEDLELGVVPSGTWTAPRHVSVSGLPLARMLAVETSDPWLYAEREGDVIRVRAVPPAPGRHEGHVRLTSPVHERRVRVAVAAPSVPGPPADGESRAGGPRTVIGAPRPDAPPWAEIGLRVLARVVDLMIFFVGFGVVVTLTGSGAPAAEPGGSTELTPAEWAGLLALVAVYGVYEIACVARWGQTLGKKLARVRVVSATTLRAPGLGRATLRWFVQLLAWATCIGAPILYLSPLWDPARRGRGWHDLSAGTVVVAADRSAAL